MFTFTIEQDDDEEGDAVVDVLVVVVVTCEVEQDVEGEETARIETFLHEQ